MSKKIVPIERIAESIRWIRGHKILLGCDLALWYGVTKKILDHAIKRSRERSLGDFMFQLNADQRPKSRRGIGFHVRERVGGYGAPIRA